MNRIFLVAAMVLGMTGVAKADWVHIQTVDVPNGPFSEMYSVSTFRSPRLLVTKDESCRRVRLSYNVFGRDLSGTVRLQLVIQPGAAATDPEGRRGQTYVLQPGQPGGATIWEVQAFKNTYDQLDNGCTYHFWVQG